MKKRKNVRVYYWPDRINYHLRRYDNFWKRFESKNGKLSTENFDLFEEALRKNKYASYSEGFLSSAVSMDSSPYRSDNSSFKKGFKEGSQVYSRPKRKKKRKK